MSSKKPENLIVNRRARFDYELQDPITVGIVLTGPEVRAVRDNRVSLRGAYVTLKDNELWLTNASFSLKTNGKAEDVTVDTSPRKLLAKRKEIENLSRDKDDGLTIVPLTITTATRYVKVSIAAAKGKKLYDKRQTIKKRDQDRDTKRLLKHV